MALLSDTHAEVATSHSRTMTQFPSAIDRPTGRTDCVISSITRRPLRYFTPDPLTDLLDRCGEQPNQRDSGNDAVAFLLVRPASRRGIRGEVDEGQAKRFASLITKRASYDTKAELLKLGKTISPVNQGLREEILFVGAPVASEAKAVFAPHARLPALMENLLIEMSRRDRKIDISIATAIIGFYCIRMHPFLDGNGRWARLIAASYGTSRGGILPGIIGALYQNIAKAELADVIWPLTNNGGLRRYVSAAQKFEEMVTQELSACGAVDKINNISSQLKGAAKTVRNYHEAMTILASEESISLASIKSLYGQSHRAAEGLMQRAHEAGGGMTELGDGLLSIKPLLHNVEIAALAAQRRISEEYGAATNDP